MLISKIVKTKWSQNTKEYYINKGYLFTKIGEVFDVNISDLKSNSNAIVQVKCEDCGIINNISYSDYNRRVLKKNKVYRCLNCSNKVNKKKTKLEDSIYYKHSWMMDYVVKEEDCKTTSFGSNKNILMKCTCCGYEKYLSPRKLYHRGFCCQNCKTDGFSYPEKILAFILKSKNIKYIKELSKKDFKWCSKYRYDFYIHSINCIIETHGLQHYVDACGNFSRNLEEEQENDRLKRELALQNGIKHYIELDCRKSEMEWIKNSVMNSELPKLLNFKEEDIDIEECKKATMGNLIKESISLIEHGVSVNEVAKMLDLNIRTVYKYKAMHYKKDNITKHKPKDVESTKLKEKGKKVCVVCHNNEIKEYESISDLASRSYDDLGVRFNIASISKCCNEITKLHKGYKIYFKTN